MTDSMAQLSILDCISPEEKEVEGRKAEPTQSDLAVASVHASPDTQDSREVELPLRTVEKTHGSKGGESEGTAPRPAEGIESTVAFSAIRPPESELGSVRPKAVAEMKKAITRVGSRRLVEVRELADEDGKEGEYRYEIVTGLLTYRAHAELKSETLRVRVLTCTDAEAVQSRLVEGIRDSGPDTWPKIINFGQLRDAIAVERGCDASEVPLEVLVARTPLDKGTVSLCCSAYKAVVGAGIDLSDPALHDLSRATFRRISAAAAEPDQVRNLVTRAQRKPARGSARVQELEDRFGALVSHQVLDEGINLRLERGVAPDEMDAFLRYVMGRIRTALSAPAETSRK